MSAAEAIETDEALPEASQPAQPMPRVHWPVLENLLDALPDQLQEKLEASWGLEAEVRRDLAAPQRLVVSASALHERALIGVLRSTGTATGWIAIDPVAGFSVLEFVLGNRGGAMMEPPERSFSPFESSVLRALVRIVTETLGKVLSPAGTLSLAFDRWMAEPIVGDDTPVISLNLTLAFAEREGRINLILPVGLFAPVQGVLGGVLSGARSAGPQWAKRLKERVAAASVELTAVLHRQALPFSQLRALGVGDRLVFDAASDPPIGLYVDDVAVATGRLGRSGPRIAVRLDQAALTRKDPQT